MTKRFHDLTRKVEAVLRDIPETRNSDIRLTIEIWKRYYPHKLIQGAKTQRLVVPLDELYNLPREDNVKRIRAQFQNDRLKYLPTTWEVAKKRKINEEVWRKCMGQGDVHGRLENIRQPYVS